MMRILVPLHSLQIGGSQINAVDLAAAIRDLGHHVVIFGEYGPLQERIDALGLAFVASAGHTPRSPSAIAELTRVARSNRADLVHAYEYYRSLESFFGPHAIGGIPMLATVLSMTVPRFLPRSVPLIVGTEALAAQSQRVWRAPIVVVEPPIDTRENSPQAGAGTLASFQRRFGIDGLPTVVVVSRLMREMKLEGVEAAIEAVASLHPSIPARLVIVGTGDAADHLAAHAQRVNDRLGLRAIVVAGPMLDPRPAYAVSDVIVGMGSSAIRGMAFAKPVVVVGEQGFCELVSPGTIERFLAAGFYGLGNGGDAAPILAGHLKRLLSDPAEREALGRFGIQLVGARYDLRSAAARLERVYRRVASRGPNYMGVVNDTASIGFRIGWEAFKVLVARAKARAGLAS
jgi:glycosyltransferase involved in cell wall biosynthesis